MVYQTDFQKDLIKNVKKFGGVENWHTHLDRAETLNPVYLAHAGIDPMKASKYPLSVKQNLVGELHKGPAYAPENLRKRMSRILKAMSEDFDVKRVYSAIDTTADIGRRGFDAALELKDMFKGKIDFQVGAYPVFGFRDDVPERWNVFEDASKDADFICTLPERDQKNGHIGYNEHLRRVLHLAAEMGKPIHVHVDQGNDPREQGTEELVHAVDYCIPPSKRVKDGKPFVWAIHAISPSAYDQSRFEDLLDGLYDCKIGVTCCPRAAMSMKQKREIIAPTRNSIARVGEMLVHKIPLRFGSDNIADVFVPTGTPDLLQEAMWTNDFIRVYGPEIYAKILTGTELNESDIYEIKDMIDQR